MKKSVRKIFNILSVSILSVTLFTGCCLTSDLLPNVSVNLPLFGEPSVDVDLPFGDVHIQGSHGNKNNNNQSSNNGNNKYNNNALPSHIQFEDAVKGKTWYSRLSDDGVYNQVYQIKLQFDTNSKTVTQEIYFWARSNYSNKYKFAGTNVQRANYYYTSDPNKLDCKTYENYNTGSFNNNRYNVTNNKDLQDVWYSLDNADMITWNGHQYISQRALANQSVTNYTNKNSFTLNR